MAISREEKAHLLERLAYSEKFESILAIRFGSAKRFGLEGVESMIPGLKTLVDTVSNMSRVVLH